MAAARRHPETRKFAPRGKSMLLWADTIYRLRRGTESAPVIDTVPAVDVDGYNRVLKGKVTLDDTDWDTITDEDNIDEKYHFFKYFYEAK